MAFRGTLTGYRASLWPLLILAFFMVRHHRRGRSFAPLAISSPLAGLPPRAGGIEIHDLFRRHRLPMLSVNFAAVIADRVLSLKLPQSHLRSVRYPSASLGGVTTRAGMG